MMLFQYSVRNEIQHRNEKDSILNFQDRINKPLGMKWLISAVSARLFSNILRVLSLGEARQVLSKNQKSFLFELLKRRFREENSQYTPAV